MSNVTEYLRSRELPFEAIAHEQTYTSIAEARALGIAADEVVKSVVLRTGGGQVLAVLPGSRRLDMKLVRHVVGDAHVRLATEDELARDFASYELGALPPLPELLGLRAYVDPEVLEHETVVFAAGTQTESIRMRAGDLFRDVPLTVASIARHGADDT